MYARVTRFKLKPGRRDEWSRLLEDMKADLHALAGLRHWASLVGDDDEVVEVAVHDAVTSVEAAMPDVLRLWQVLAPIMEEQPTSRFFHVVRFDTVFDTV